MSKVNAAVERLLATARSEVGYLEKASNSNLDDKTANAGKGNWTKYARDLNDLGDFYNGNKNGYDWCDVFTDWCFVTTFGKELALQLLCAPIKSCGAGCKYSAGYYQTKGQFYTENPQPGDQIFFGDAASWWHTGIVEKVDSKYVYTIEGNTSGASGVISNGGGVASKKYALNHKNIKGYGRPDWSLVQVSAAQTQKPQKPVLTPTNKTSPNKPINLIGDESAAQQEFEAMWRTMRSKWQDNDAAAWSQEARDWCLEKGLIVGSNGKDSNYMWGDMLTREQAAQLFYRFAQIMGVK